MGQKALSGAAYIGTAQAVRVLLTIVSTIIVARILTPDEFGVIAMVTPVTAFLLLFQNLGLSHAAIQAKSLSNQQSNALFWLNMAASGAITLILIGLAPVVAWFYGDPRPGYVTAASSATILLSGSAIQHMALLNRDLRFATISRIDIATTIVGFGATIAAALILRSYWALWLGSFVGAVVGRSLVWRASKWRPTLKITFKGSGDLLNFGAAITGFNFLNFFHRNIDNVLIGKVWGPEALGLYDRSYKLMMFPLQNINSPLGRIMLPLLSKLNEEPDRYRRTYLLALRALMLATVPAVIVAAATSDRLVPFLLGEQWAGASPIFFWLSLAALLQPVGSSTGWLFISSGRPGALTRWACFQMAITVPAFVVAVQWGPAMVAAVYFVIGAALLPPAFAYAVKGTSVRTIDLYAACAPFAGAGAVSWGLIAWALPDWPTAIILGVAVPLSYAMAVAACWIAPEGRLAIRTIWSLAISGLLTRPGGAISKSHATPAGD